MCDCEPVIIRLPKGFAKKIDEIAVHKLREYNTVTEFVIESTRQYSTSTRQYLKQIDS
jgi:hypothetical protein